MIKNQLIFSGGSPPRPHRKISFENSTISWWTSLLTPPMYLCEPNQARNDTREIATGSKVKIVGMTIRPDMNGTDGIVLKTNHRPGAHAVQLATGQIIGVRQDFLELTEEMVTLFQKNMQQKQN